MKIEGKRYVRSKVKASARRDGRASAVTDGGDRITKCKNGVIHRLTLQGAASVNQNLCDDGSHCVEGLAGKEPCSSRALG